MKRSLLFIPGNTPNLLINGDILGADGIIYDLEDAVAPSEKDAARILVRNTLRSLCCANCERIVRINPLTTEYWRRDLEEILPFGPDGIMPVKMNSAQEVQEISQYMAEIEKRHHLQKNRIKLIPLIETALGVENAFQIASADKRVSAIFLGGEDLTADLQCKRTKEGTEILYARCRIVYAARAAGVAAYDTPFTDVEDLEGLYQDAKLAKSLGFTGKVSISPRHIEAINQIFSPTQEELDYAQEVFEALRIAKEQGKGVVALRGKMLDAPIVERARQILEMGQAVQKGRCCNE